MIATLANWPVRPNSVPISMLAASRHPVADVAALDPLEFVRTVVVARVPMPRSMVRLSTGLVNLRAKRRRRWAFSREQIRFSTGRCC